MVGRRGGARWSRVGAPAAGARAAPHRVAAAERVGAPAACHLLHRLRSASTSCVSEPTRTLLSSSFSRMTRAIVGEVVDRQLSDRRASLRFDSAC
jgi:hypothetical protein